jgi:hypothetical protein
MKTSKMFMSIFPCLTAIGLAILPALGASGTFAEAQPPAEVQQGECVNQNASQLKAVALSAPRTATVDFSGSGGQLDPVPLLETQISGGPTCVVVNFSAQADPQDNFIVFQASIDDIPMQGQTQFPYLTPAPTTPVVFNPEETNLNISKMVSYTFFSRVERGTHTVRIRFAGCCSTNPGSGLVRAAVMSVHY